MATDFRSTPDDFTPPTDVEDMPFAPAPAWERGKKRRGFGMGRTSRVAPESRTFAAEPEPAIVTTPGPAVAAGETPFYETQADADTTFVATPAYASRSAARKGSSAPVAIVAGLIVLGGLAAAGWYYTKPHGAGVAELTPGDNAAATTTTATSADAAAAAPGAATPQLADAGPPPPAPVTRHTTTTTTTTSHTTRSLAPARGASASHTRSARAASDESADVSASATVQAPPRAAPAPAPMPAAPPPAAAAPAPPLVLNIPPASTQAAPAPTQTAPAPAPTPPTQTPPQ